MNLVSKGPRSVAAAAALISVALVSGPLASQASAHRRSRHHRHDHGSAERHHRRSGTTRHHKTRHHKSEHHRHGAVVKRTGSTTAGTPSTERSGPSFFVIGVFDQPSYSFSKWAGRGVNTIVDYDSLSGTVPFSTWHSALVANHLYAIRQPVGNLVQDAQDPALLAWMQPDEPDTNGEAAEVAANYALWHAAAPQVPIWENFNGGHIPNSSETAYAPMLASTDWVSNDLYPVTGWDQPSQIDLSEGGDWIGWTINTLNNWSGGKPQFQILETSNQKLSWVSNPRGVTPDELRGTVWDSVIHGVKGVFYFPQSFGGGFQYDATPDDVAAEMTSVDQQLAAWSGVLLAPGQQVTMPKPFLRATRTYDGQTYTFTLNFSHGTATLNGQSYRPYQLQITNSNGTTASAPASAQENLTYPAQ